MKMKVSRAQFTALLNIFNAVCNRPVPPNFEARLMMILLESIRKQLIKKSVDFKKKYSLTMSDQEALSFFIFFKKFHFFPEDAIYETVLVDSICNGIHQQYTII